MHAPLYLQATTRYSIVASLALLIASANAHPRIEDKINSVLPHRNETAGIEGEIKCYALPYGCIGLLSHLLFYWTVAWIAYGGRAPFWPWHKLDSWKFDTVLAIAPLLATLPIGAISIYRCKQTWPFILMAVWKMMMSVTLSLVTIHRALIVRRAIQMSRAREQDGILLRNQSPSPSPSPYTPPDARFGFTPASERFSYFSSSTSPYLSPKAPSPSYRPVPSHESLVPVSRPNTSKSPSGWVILHLLGTFVGLTGLIAVIRADFGNNRELRNLTYGFVITTIVITIGAASAFYMKGWDKWMANERGGRLCFNTGMKAGGAALGAFLASLGVLGALYSDLVLGAVAHNWTGMPNEDNALLYWSWFISKRIPLFAY